MNIEANCRSATSRCDSNGGATQPIGFLKASERGINIMLTGESYPVMTLDVIGGKARFKRVLDLWILQLVAKDQRGREGRIFGESIDSPCMRGEVFDPAERLFEDCQRNITLAAAFIGEINQVEDESDPTKEFIELSKMLTKQRILVLVGDQRFILFGPLFELVFWPQWRSGTKE